MNAFARIAPQLPHSCYPNCALNGHNQLVLLRPVAPGERLTIDYATLYMGPEPVLDCHCGHIGCRGKILGFNYLPVVFQEYYLQRNAVCPEVSWAADRGNFIRQLGRSKVLTPNP